MGARRTRRQRREAEDALEGLARTVLDDGASDPAALETRDQLVQTANAQGVRVETISSEAEGDVARYAAMLSTGMYAAAYLQLGLDG